MTSASQLRVFLAGRVAVEANGHVVDEARFPGRQGRLLFAYLAAERGRAVPRHELAEALWDDAPPATWDKALTVIASKLRGVLTDSGVDGAAALTGAFGCYRLELPEGSWVDVLAAEDAAAEAEEALAQGDLAAAKAAGSLAASLTQRPLLPGDDGAWVEEKRHELTQVRVRALGVLADACLRSGDAAAAAAWAEQAAALEPFRESGYRRLMAAHVAGGNRAEALRVYERCRRLLADELGAYPSPETDSVFRSLLETAPSSNGKADANAAPASGPPHRRSRRGPVILLLAALLVAGAVAAAFALLSRGGDAAPRVLPNSLVRLDAHTLKVKQVVPVVDAPDLVVASGGYLWVTSHVLRDINSGALRNGGDRALTRVDPSTGKAVVVGGGLAPCGLTADPSGDVWVANCYPASNGTYDDVVRIDARTLQFKQTWPVSGGTGFYRALTYGGGSLWVTQLFGGDVPNGNAVTRLNPQTGARRVFRPLHVPAGLAWAGDYGDLWIAGFTDGTLTRLDGSSGAMTVYGVGGNPAFPVVDGDTVWAADWALPDVARVQAVGAGHPRQVQLPARSLLHGVWDVAAGAGAIWAATPRLHAIWRIDPRTNAVRRVGMPYFPAGVATGGDNLWVTVRGS